MEATVIIPCKDAADTLGEQLDALAAQSLTSGQFDVIVVDDGSSDDPAAIVASRVDRINVRLVSNTGPPGPSSARNHGVRLARGAVVAFCDADDVVQPGWLCALLRTLQWHDIVGGPCVPFWDAPDGRHVREIAEHEPPRRFRFLPFVGTGNLALRRELFLSAGGLRTDWDCGEDVEFCWRLQLDGASLGWASDAVLLRRERQKLTTAFRQGLAYGRADVRLIREFQAVGAVKPTTQEALGQLAVRARRYRSGWSPSARLDLGRESSRHLARIAAGFRFGMWCP